MSVTRADVLDAIAKEPDGITTAELAEKMHVPRYTVSSVLSKLAAYGRIVKAPRGLKVGNASAAIWLPKAMETASISIEADK